MSSPQKTHLELLTECALSNEADTCRDEISNYILDVNNNMVKKSDYLKKADVLTELDKIIGGYNILLDEYGRLKVELGKCNSEYNTNVVETTNLINNYKENVKSFHDKCVNCVDTSYMNKNTVKVNNLKALHMYSLIQKDKGKIKLFISIITLIFVLLVLRFYRII